MTNLKEALHAAGFQSARERLRIIATQALIAHPLDPIARRTAIIAAIADEPALIWLLFERHLVEATDRLVATVRQNQGGGRDADGEPPTTSARVAWIVRQDRMSTARDASC